MERPPIDLALTPRSIAADRNLSVTVHCERCRMLREFDVWKVPVRLRDDPLAYLPLRCERCRTPAKSLSVSRAVHGTVEKVADVTLWRPR